MNGRILIVDRDEALREKVQIELRSAGFNVESASKIESALLREAGGPTPDLILCDVAAAAEGNSDSLLRLQRRFPGVAIALIGTESETAREALRRGTFAALARPLCTADVELLVERAGELRRLQRCASLLGHENQRSVGQSPIFGASEAMIALLEELEQVATLDTAVLVRGEPGTGKEVIARALHAQSSRRNAPFTTLPARMRSTTRLEADLLGRAPKARADNDPPSGGLLRNSRHGTLFIDEIGALPRSLQRRLVHCLGEDDARSEAMGGVRLLASTSRDLESEVQNDRFEAELLALVAPAELTVPALRERTEDIPLLADHFIERSSARLDRTGFHLRDDALERLVRYDWPGNVRELANVMETACLLAKGNTLDARTLPEHVANSEERGGASNASLRHARRGAEKAAIQAALAATGGNRTHAARRLEISHRSLLYKIKEFDLRDSSPPGAHPDN